MATLGEQFADDIVWHAGGRSTIAGDYRAVEIFGMFEQYAERPRLTFGVDIHDVLASDELSPTRRPRRCGKRLSVDRPGPQRAARSPRQSNAAGQ